MEFKKQRKNRMLGRVLALVVALCLMLSLSITATAATENQAVTEAKNGVVQIQVWFYDQEAAVEHFLHSGTGFLINENTVVTCQHVATGFPDEWYVEWAQSTNEALGGKRTAAQVKENLELRVSVYRDIYVKATVKKASTEMDYAILTLKETLSTRTPLKLRDSSQLNQTEEVFALGYPGDIASIEDANHYDADDVTITSGNVNKVGDMTFMTTDGGVYDSVNCVESSALITAGNSGGPLVDAEGNVVGINAVASDTRNIAISSKQLIDVLDALGIEYSTANSIPVVNPNEGEEDEKEEVSVDTSELSSLIAEAESKDADVYTEESYEKMKEALYEAKAALGSTTQAEIDVAVDKLDDAVNALEKAEDSSMNTFVLIGIIAAVVLVIVVLIVVIILSGKNKKAASVAPAAPVSPVAKQPTPVRATTTTTTTTTTTPAASSETTVLSQGAGETTVLSNGAGETTVLSQAVNGGTLVRTSNNERIPICSADFSIGREKTKVDYCVGGNTNISRIHARFVVRDNVTYIVDNKAANGTFVNGVKARAGQEIEIKNGDTILLADEKFEFNK